MDMTLRDFISTIAKQGEEKGLMDMPVVGVRVQNGDGMTGYEICVVSEAEFDAHYPNPYVRTAAVIDITP